MPSHCGVSPKNTDLSVTPAAAAAHWTTSGNQHRTPRKRMKCRGVNIPAISTKMAAWSSRRSGAATGARREKVVGAAQGEEQGGGAGEHGEGRDPPGVAAPLSSKKGVRQANTPAPKRCVSELNGSLNPGMG